MFDSWGLTISGVMDTVLRMGELLKWVLSQWSLRDVCVWIQIDSSSHYVWMKTTRFDWLMDGLMSLIDWLIDYSVDWLIDYLLHLADMFAMLAISFENTSKIGRQNRQSSRHTWCGRVLDMRQYEIWGPSFERRSDTCFNDTLYRRWKQNTLANQLIW